MSELNVFEAAGVYKAGVEKGVQFYNIVGKNSAGEHCALIFGCKMNFADAIDKSFSRLFPIQLPKKEEVINDGTSENQSSEVGATEEHGKVEDGGDVC